MEQNAGGYLVIEDSEQFIWHKVGEYDRPNKRKF